MHPQPESTDDSGGCGHDVELRYRHSIIEVVSLVCVLDTPNRAQFDAACSLLRHEGIPFELRETRGGIVPYFTTDELRIFVSAPHAQEAGELLALLDQPAFPAYRPYRDPELELLEDEADEEAAAPPPRNVRRAMALLALATLAVVAVTIGFAMAMRERFARAEPRMTPQSYEYGATSLRAFRGR
jgi:hypothetical protein